MNIIVCVKQVVDISEMKRGVIRTRLKLPNEVYTVVSEVLETGKSSDLMEYQDPNSILINIGKETVF